MSTEPEFDEEDVQDEANQQPLLIDDGFDFITDEDEEIRQGLSNFFNNARPF